ncbi:MAG TPA: hypothetical protein ENI87_01800 [bacterium]|nr:hypothetical protein [bacterium]
MVTAPAIARTNPYAQDVSFIDVPWTTGGGGFTDPIDLAGLRPVLVIVPSSFTGTGIGVQFSEDGSNWYPVGDRDGVLTLAAAAGRAVTIPYDVIYPLDGWVRFDMGATPASDTNLRVGVTTPRP